MPEHWGQPIDGPGLAAWRKLRRINQRELATILGISHITVANWERGLYEVPRYLHLALEAVDTRLSFARPAPVLPARGPRRRTAAAGR